MSVQIIGRYFVRQGRCGNGKWRSERVIWEAEGRLIIRLPTTVLMLPLITSLLVTSKHGAILAMQKLDNFTLFVSPCILDAGVSSLACLRTLLPGNQCFFIFIYLLLFLLYFTLKLWFFFFSIISFRAPFPRTAGQRRRPLFERLPVWTRKWPATPVGLQRICIMAFHATFGCPKLDVVALPGKKMQ